MYIGVGPIVPISITSLVGALRGRSQGESAVAKPTRFTEYCTVIVDVAPGQLLDVQFRDGGRQPPIPQEQLCRDAEQVAGVARGTLLSAR